MFQTLHKPARNIWHSTTVSKPAIRGRSGYTDLWSCWVSMHRISVICQVQPRPVLVDTGSPNQGRLKRKLALLSYSSQNSFYEKHIENTIISPATDEGCQQPKSALFINSTSKRYYRLTSIKDLKWIPMRIWTFPTWNAWDTYPLLCRLNWPDYVAVLLDVFQHLLWRNYWQ